jgi:hypothetical protein
MTTETSVLPRTVEILTSRGWSVAGNYAAERADHIVELLAAEGAIARAGGDILDEDRALLVWKEASEREPDVYIGVAFEDMRLFVLAAVENTREWVLRSAVPGDIDSIRRFEEKLTATDAAERVLVAFIARIKAL